MIRRGREQYGLEIHPSSFGTDSRPVLIAEKYADLPIGILVLSAQPYEVLKQVVEKVLEEG